MDIRRQHAHIKRMYISSVRLDIRNYYANIISHSISHREVYNLIRVANTRSSNFSQLDLLIATDDRTIVTDWVLMPDMFANRFLAQHLASVNMVSTHEGEVDTALSILRGTDCGISFDRVISASISDNAQLAATNAMFPAHIYTYLL